MIQNEYAKALYELAVEENKVELIFECLKAVVLSTEDKEYLKVMSSPFISGEDKKLMIVSIYKSLDQTFINFLKVLIDNNRFSLISEIYESYKNLILESKSIVCADVYSVDYLNNQHIASIKTILEKKYNKEILINNIVDKNLVGGLKITINGEIIDLSVKSSLSKLKELL